MDSPQKMAKQTYKAGAFYFLAGYNESMKNKKDHRRHRATEISKKFTSKNKPTPIDLVEYTCKNIP